jgi:hypothetical protein
MRGLPPDIGARGGAECQGGHDGKGVVVSLVTILTENKEVCEDEVGDERLIDDDDDGVKLWVEQHSILNSLSTYISLWGLPAMSFRVDHVLSELLVSSSVVAVRGDGSGEAARPMHEEIIKCLHHSC